ncbi:MAG: hypothetical protein LDLANPLL_00549 [Turneriella sp.]|nr:hypothetical protein [Turneriella sp.]
MKNLFLNKYRIESARLKGYDYASHGFYFVTICTKNREYFFGNIENGVIHFSAIGQMAEKFWHEIPDHFSHVVLDEFVVMPNHVHGIIQITDNPVETQHAASLQSFTKQLSTKKNISSGSLPAIIRSYKSAVKKWATMNKINFAWQSRFHDHVIRNEQSLNQIRLYIQQNPKNWHADDLYKSSGENQNKTDRR